MNRLPPMGRLFLRIGPLASWLWLWACTFQPDLGDRYPECGPGGECLEGCRCLDGKVCVPESADAPPFCRESGESPTCMQPDLIVTVSQDVDDGNPDGLSLREALKLAGGNPGPHHIVFKDVTGIALQADLPPIPSATYLDGGAGVILQAGGTAVVGLILDGAGVVVSGIELVGFSGCGVRIRSGSADVHLFRMRVGHPDLKPNGNGIEILGPSSGIVVGRGRELECVDAVEPQPGGPLAEYDINVVVANSGDGILADGVTDLSVYGTWVGFSNVNDSSRHNWALGNGGVGIHLKNVNGAVIGAQHLSEEEATSGRHDPLPAFVASGRNQGGVLIEGGGDIRMPGLIIGDTPTMVPYDENRLYNLRIQGNTGPVTYGPAPEVEGYEALYFGLIYTETTVPVEIQDAQAGVFVRGVQFVTEEVSGPTTGVLVSGPRAPVHLWHLSLTGNFQDSVVKVENVLPGGRVELVNNLFWRFHDLDVPVVQSAAGDPEVLAMRGNLKCPQDGIQDCGFGDWCAGVCPDAAGLNHQSDRNPLWGCTADRARPLSVDCPTVDRGLSILAENGKPIDQNGPYNGSFNGCAPDIGAFECMTPECRNQCP